MKKLLFGTMLAASVAAYGQQVNFSSFAAMSYEKKGEDFKSRIGEGFSVSYDISPAVGIGFQWKHKELCPISSAAGAVFPMNASSLQFYIHQTPRKEVKWFFSPRAGIMAGIGTPIRDPSQDQSLAARKQDMKILDHPYFAGIMLEIGAGMRLSPRMTITAYLEDEGLVGMVTHRPIVYENGASFGSAITGIRVTIAAKK